MSDFLEHFIPKTDGKIELSFPNESVNNSINTYQSGNNTSLNFCCVYCEEIYKKYFELISKHVKSYLGQAKDDNTGKISQKNGTDFNNDLTPEAKQAKEKQNVKTPD